MHLSVLKEKRKNYLDLYQIIIKHNRTWTVRELIFFLISIIIIVIYVCNLLSRKRIVLSQAVAGLLLFLFLGVVFGSTVSARKPTVSAWLPADALWRTGAPSLPGKRSRPGWGRGPESSAQCFFRASGHWPADGTPQSSCPWAHLSGAVRQL